MNSNLHRLHQLFNTVIDEQGQLSQEQFRKMQTEGVRISTLTERLFGHTGAGAVLNLRALQRLLESSAFNPLGFWRYLSPESSLEIMNPITTQTLTINYQEGHHAQFLVLPSNYEIPTTPTLTLHIRLVSPSGSQQKTLDLNWDTQSQMKFLEHSLLENLHSLIKVQQTTPHPTYLKKIHQKIKLLSGRRYSHDQLPLSEHPTHNQARWTHLQSELLTAQPILPASLTFHQILLEHFNNTTSNLQLLIHVFWKTERQKLRINKQIHYLQTKVVLIQDLNIAHESDYLQLWTITTRERMALILRTLYFLWQMRPRWFYL